jgi:CheY-like chemotaxis protein
MAGQPYHLAILDYQLPGMNGAELAKQIRLDEALRDMQLIMLSSVGDAEELDAALEVDIRLTKPLRQSDLHDAIATLFGERTRPLSVGHERSSRAVNFHGQRVLLVEDNPLSQSLGQEMLRRCGLETQVASTGREALQWVQQASFDIILMDVQMPQMDGYEATARILQWEAETSTKHTPIIALTAHALPQDRQRCLEAGMDDYLVKPYDQESLSNIIFRWLTSPALPPGQTVQDAVDQVFETSKLQQIKAMMGDSFSRLLEQFRDDVTQQLSLVASALTTHDHAGLQDAVHRIKNNAGDLGALALFDTASVLERQLQSGAFDEVLGRQLLDQGERVLAAIAQRQTGASP